MIGLDFMVGFDVTDVFSVLHPVGRGVLETFGAGKVADMAEGLERQGGLLPKQPAPGAAGPAAKPGARPGAGGAQQSAQQPMQQSPPPTSWPLWKIGAGLVGLVGAGLVVVHFARRS